MNTVKFSCVVTPNNSSVLLGIEIWIDQHCVINMEHVNTAIPVSCDFEDNDGERSLRIVLKNKQVEHTVVDDHGNIVSDAMLTVSDLRFDDFDCTTILHDLAVYRHNFNGTADSVEDKFFGDMGCNGTVELKFSTPLYLWLLENM